MGNIVNLSLSLSLSRTHMMEISIAHSPPSSISLSHSLAITTSISTTFSTFCHQCLPLCCFLSLTTSPHLFSSSSSLFTPSFSLMRPNFFVACKLSFQLLSSHLTCSLTIFHHHHSLLFSVSRMYVHACERGGG